MHAAYVVVTAAAHEIVVVVVLFSTGQIYVQTPPSETLERFFHFQTIKNSFSVVFSRLFRSCWKHKKSRLMSSVIGPLYVYTSFKEKGWSEGRGGGSLRVLRRITPAHVDGKCCSHPSPPHPPLGTHPYLLTWKG